MGFWDTLANVGTFGLYGAGTGAANAIGGINLGDVGDAIGGHAAQVPPTYWGGSQGAAGQATAREQGIGAANAQDMASLGANYGQQFGQLGQQFGGQQQGAYGQSQQAMGLLGQTAQGQGPAQSAAQSQLQQGVDQSIQAQANMANSTRGGFGQANAQHDALQAGAQQRQQAAAQAAQLRAQMASQAQGQYAGAANQLYGQASGNQIGAMGAGMQGQLGYLQAGLGNQLGYEQLGTGIQNSASQQALANQQLAQGVVGQNAHNAQDVWTGLLSTGGGIGAAAAMSDERVKVPADGAGSADRFLGGLTPHTYRYLSPEHEPNPEHAGEGHLGVFAQELERTPEGAQAVQHGPDGLKRLNVPALTGSLAAGLGRLHERLLHVEARLGAGLR